ncbi:Uncharacterised protein [Campylobacter geochelonis]|nr:Uncharacterised protein [Campylobacter geochelonis]
MVTVFEVALPAEEDTIYPPTISPFTVPPEMVTAFFVDEPTWLYPP